MLPFNKNRNTENQLNFFAEFSGVTMMQNYNKSDFMCLLHWRPASEFYSFTEKKKKKGIFSKINIRDRSNFTCPSGQIMQVDLNFSFKLYFIYLSAGSSPTVSLPFEII